MSENSPNILDCMVTTQGEPPSTVVIRVKLRTWLVYLMSMLKPSIRSSYDWENGCFKPSEMPEATDEYLLSFIEKTAREHSLPCDWTTGSSSTSDTSSQSE